MTTRNSKDNVLNALNLLTEVEMRLNEVVQILTTTVMTPKEKRGFIKAVQQMKEATPFNQLRSWVTETPIAPLTGPAQAEPEVAGMENFDATGLTTFDIRAHPLWELINLDPAELHDPAFHRRNRLIDEMVALAGAGMLPDPDVVGLFNTQENQGARPRSPSRRRRRREPQAASTIAQTDLQRSPRMPTQREIVHGTFVERRENGGTLQPCLYCAVGSHYSRDCPHKENNNTLEVMINHQRGRCQDCVNAFDNTRFRHII